MDAQGWATIIGAIFLGLMQLLGMYLSHLRSKELRGKVDEVRLQTDGVIEMVVTRAEQLALEEGRRQGKQEAKMEMRNRGEQK